MFSHNCWPRRRWRPKKFKISDGLWKNKKLWDLYNKASTPYPWHAPLFKYAKKIGIDIFSTPFDEDGLVLLKKLKCKKIINIGNLKFSDNKKTSGEILPQFFLSTLKKRLNFVASSTHQSEEILVGKTHLVLKKKFKNLLTIIIPRHINRVSKIKSDLTSLGLKIITRSSKEKIEKNTDIYLVDTYGETRKFFKIAKTIFMGGSIVNHGGQNPIEPARFGLNIIHGPNVGNFKEIFKLLKFSYINVVIGNGFEKNPLSFRYCEFLSASFFSRRTKVIVFNFLIHQLLV